MNTIIIDKDIHVDVLPDGETIVRFISDRTGKGGGYSEKRRTFKSPQSAAKKLREELADELEAEAETGEAVEAGDAKWSGEPYPVKEALRKLEASQLESKGAKQL